MKQYTSATSADSIDTALGMKSSVSVELVPISALKQYITNTPHVLGVISYNSPLKYRIPCLNIELESISNQPIVEVWRSDETVESGREGQIHFAKNSHIIFGCINEKCITDLEDHTKQIYLDLLRFLGQQNYGHLVRIWNQFPKINAVETNIERYQKFCSGRQWAFRDAFGTDFHDNLPAASAIGTQKKAFSLYFIASKSPVSYLENPRQTRAYEYPNLYGPCSPSFARATLFQNNGVSKLFISGTASIVGHETFHLGDIRRQLEETLNNIDSIVEHNKNQSNQLLETQFPIIKVYLRDPASKVYVKNRLREYFGSSADNILYLHGDICRGELLLEIEGVCDLSGQRVI